MKLPNGYGSVHKLSGRRRKPWRARKTDSRVFVDRTTGEEITVTPDMDYRNLRLKQKYTTIGYYASQKEALQALSDYNKDPYDLRHNTITFGEVYDKWSDIHFSKVSDSNVKGYKAAFKLCAPLCAVRFVEIKLDHLQKIVDESGKNTPTLKKLKIMFGLMYDYAVMHEIVTPDKREMVRYIDITKAGNPNAYNRKPFSLKEVKSVWKTVDSDEYLQIVLVLIYTGLRIGELYNLRKEDVHLGERWLYVREAKTDSGVREVPIAEKIVPFFEHWMKKDSEWMFCNRQGRKFLDKNFRDSYWNPIMQVLNYKHRPHDTRHTCVSMLATAGVDERVIKKIVGHKGHGVTETVYTHLELPIKLEAINKI